MNGQCAIPALKGKPLLPNSLLVFNLPDAFQISGRRHGIISLALDQSLPLESIDNIREATPSMAVKQKSAVRSVRQTQARSFVSMSRT
ncbi:hypothetical protein O206_21955 [Ochrobactrum sp. EGD-AQ16]|nr:hypothetical protein O206_21955 [Ochrobactrum sp. EGD-AQ16]